MEMSHTNRDLIPLQSLFMEMASLLGVPIDKTKFYSTILEDNQGYIHLSRFPKVCPCMNHKAIKYHHFRDHVRRGEIIFTKVHTEEQVVDIFTEPLNREAYDYLQEKLMG